MLRAAINRCGNRSPANSSPLTAKRSQQHNAPSNQQPQKHGVAEVRWYLIWSRETF